MEITGGNPDATAAGEIELIERTALGSAALIKLGCLSSTPSLSYKGRGAT